MASRNVSEKVAFAILAKASSQSNRKLSVIAGEIVNEMDVTDLPHALDA